MNIYLKNFFKEKKLEFVEWELTADNSDLHFISNQTVIEHIEIANEQEQEQISNVIRQIDFKNGNVNHFLKHLAGAIINK